MSSTWLTSAEGSTKAHAGSSATILGGFQYSQWKEANGTPCLSGVASSQVIS